MNIPTMNIPLHLPAHLPLHLAPALILAFVSVCTAHEDEDSSSHLPSHGEHAQIALDGAIPRNPELRWFKGNLHTHSLWSDGDDFPEMIAEWYRTHGYNFLALSDHNVLSQGQRWMKQSAIVKRGGKDALAKYQARFGGGWVQTRGEVDSPGFEIRLKPIDEFRYLVEQRGEFIMIPSEEISDRAQGKPVHMNATNIGEAIAPLGGETVREAMSNNLRAIEEQSERLGREILLHLNHPNFGWAVTAEDLASVMAERFFEVYNGHPGVNQLGDAKHLSVERIWDVANSIRLTTMQAPPLFGIATDDSHDYHDPAGNHKGSHTGRGWVMVRSRYLTPEHLIAGLKDGDFYASSGVVLSDIQYTAETKTLRLNIDGKENATYTTEFIGTRAEPLSTKLPAKEDIGIVLASVTGTKPEFTIPEGVLYVRALVTSDQRVDDPSFADQRKQAWTQPVAWQIDEANQASDAKASDAK